MRLWLPAALVLCLVQLSGRTQADAGVHVAVAASDAAEASASNRSRPVDDAPEPAVDAPANQGSGPADSLDAAAPPSAEVAPADAVVAPTGSLSTPDSGGVEVLDLWLPGTNAWGSRGGMHVDVAHGLRPHAFVINLLVQVGHATSLFAPGDSAFFNRERLAVAWAPIRGLELGLSEDFAYSRWSTYLDASVATIGDPTLHVKYSRDISAAWAWGAVATWLVPSAVGSASLVPAASTLTLSALGSYRPIAPLELSANVGVVIDGSDRLAATVAPDKRFVYQVNTGSGAWLGLAATSHFKAGDAVGFLPFVEVSGVVKSLSGFSTNPVQLTAGLKAHLLHASVFEVTVGADVRLTGAPRVGGDAPGLFPWMAFAALSAHLFDAPPPLLGATACDTHDDCLPAQRCISGFCSYVTEVIKEVTRLKVVRGKSFVVAGRVFDNEVKRPIEGAQVLFAGFESTPVAVDLKTGNYRSFPLDVGQGLLRMRVIAPNYRPFEQLIDRSTTTADLRVDVGLHRAERPDMGTLKGSLKDARTGRAIPFGKIVLVTLSQSIAVDKNGLFVGQVAAGHHDVLVVAHGYVTQRKRISVHDADVIILNVDMQRMRKSNNPESPTLP